MSFFVMAGCSKGYARGCRRQAGKSLKTKHQAAQHKDLPEKMRRSCTSWWTHQSILRDPSTHTFENGSFRKPRTTSTAVHQNNSSPDGLLLRPPLSRPLLSRTYGIAWNLLISLYHMNDNGLVTWQSHCTYENLLDTSWHSLKHVNTSWCHSLASFLLRPSVERRHWLGDWLACTSHWGILGS